MANHVSGTVLIVFFVVCGVCLHGCSMKEPVLSQIVQVDVLTDHVVDIKSYELPKGSFRGALWFPKSPQSFEIRIVSGNKFIGRKESFYHIPAPAPSEFSTKNIDGIDGWIVDVTDDWIIEESILPENRMTYLLKRKDGSKAFQLYMPLRKQHYSFSVLKNDHGDEIVLFMDLSEYVVGKGIFGYVII